MRPKHYVYVVKCADETLYTGYAVDVQARLEAHNAGNGAKYTKARLPVELLASACYYTKQRAMSAEYRFKQLSRSEKENLISMADPMSFKEVLDSKLPGFSEEPIFEFVTRSLFENADEGYRDFIRGLVPHVDENAIIGVRTPVLRSIAKQMLKRQDLKDYLRASPHDLFEEQQIHAFVVGSLKDYDMALQEINRFLPSVDNWATCDQLGVKPLKNNLEETLKHAKNWISSSHTYTARYGIGVLMRCYLDDLFDCDYLKMVANRYAPDDYYLNMMRAWFFAECAAMQPDVVLPYLEGDVLDEWTRKKSIQKALESRRVSAEMKERLKKAR